MTPSASPEKSEERKVSNFIRNIIEQDIAEGKRGQVSRAFPGAQWLPASGTRSDLPEFRPGGALQRRVPPAFDDTNPTKKRTVQSIKEDVRWLGFDWGAHEYYASDYFDQLQRGPSSSSKGQGLCLRFEQRGNAEYRGTLTEPGATARTETGWWMRTDLCADGGGRV